MRKIELDLTEAIRHGVFFNRDNTQYWPQTGTVKLYGHAIAQKEGAGWKFNLCGHNTATTRSRLAAIATTQGLNPVRSVRGRPMAGTVEVPVEGWFFP